MNTTEPFDFLLSLEQRAMKGSAGLPETDRVEEEWVGVGFRIGDNRLIAPMSEVREILDMPEFTRVPGVKSWVVGIANVRGSLLPIMDLKGFMLGEDIRQRNKGRLIVIDYKGFDTALVVEEIYGMRHFRESDALDETPPMDEKISPYIERVLDDGEERWPVFSFSKMAEDERFVHASL